MQRQKQFYLLTIMLAWLYGAMGFWGCTTSQAPDSEPPVKIETAALRGTDIPVWGAITHVHEPDSGSSTVIDIVIGDSFNGTLPDDIDTITVIGPKGDLALKKSEFIYLPQFRDFWISISPS